jgi:CHAD domain-containing protein
MATVNGTILSNLEALRSRLPPVRDGNRDAIHDARVATRRLRAALPLLCVGATAAVVEQATPMLRALGRALGRAREEDEALGLIDDIERRSPAAAAAAATLRARLLPRQMRRRRRLIKTIESLDLDALDRLRDAACRSGFSRPWAADPAGSVLRHAVGRRAGITERKVHHAGGVYFPNRAHRARITIKKLRYLAELMDRSDRLRKPAVRTLRDAQEALGSIHDREMLLGRLSQVMEEEEVQGARELARVLEAECRALFENYRAMRPAVLSACADLAAWAQRSIASRPLRRLVAVGAIALPPAAMLLAHRARRANERHVAPHASARSDPGDSSAIPEVRHALDVR